MSDIWAEIFKRLPVKTLGQCRCVCKSWDSLIVSPSFIAAHIKHYSENEINAFLLYKHVSESPPKQEEYFLFLDSAEKNTNLEANHSFTCPLVPRGNPHHFRIIGSVNGLLLLSDEIYGASSCLILWNPLLRRYVVLPVTSSATPQSITMMKVFGLGYDSKNADHKVVMLGYKQGGDGVDLTPPLVEVYSAREGKWKGISDISVMDICICRYYWSQCFLNGAIHWISWERDGLTRIFKQNCLLLFDVEREKFKKMKVPEALSKEETLTIKVSEYGGKLSLLNSRNMGENNIERCEIWVKKVYTVGSSWCRMVNIEVDSFAKGWQCLRRNGEVLGVTTGKELASYDPATGEFVGLGIHGLKDSWFTFPYTESLSLLDYRTGVYTYRDAGSRIKKRYKYIIGENGSPVLKEEEVEDSKAYDHSVGILEHPEYAQILLDHMRKIGGGAFDFAISRLMHRSPRMQQHARQVQPNSTPEDNMICFMHYPDA